MKSTIINCVFMSCVLSVVPMFASSSLDMSLHDAGDELEVATLVKNEGNGELPHLRGEPINEKKSSSAFPVWYRTKKGQAVYKTLPIAMTWDVGVGNGSNGFPSVGQFVDINGDGLQDFVISYYEVCSNSDACLYYRATLLNNGGEGWIMQACETNMYCGHRFAQCE